MPSSGLGPHWAAIPSDCTVLSPRRARATGRGLEGCPLHSVMACPFRQGLQASLWSPAAGAVCPVRARWATLQPAGTSGGPACQSLMSSGLSTRSGRWAVGRGHVGWGLAWAAEQVGLSCAWAFTVRSSIGAQMPPSGPTRALGSGNTHSGQAFAWFGLLVMLPCPLGPASACEGGPVNQVLLGSLTGAGAGAGPIGEAGMLGQF